MKKKDNSVSIHQRNFKLMATEMIKLYNNMNPERPYNIFK